jgi:hypothetical protein
VLTRALHRFLSWARSIQSILWFSYVQINLYLVHGSHSPFNRKVYIRLLVQCHLTSCTPTKSNLHSDISFATLMSEPAPYKLLTFQVPNLMSIFFRLGCLSKDSAQVQGPLWHFVTSLIFTVSSG